MKFPVNPLLKRENPFSQEEPCRGSHHETPRTAIERLCIGSKLRRLNPNKAIKVQIVRSRRTRYTESIQTQ